MRFLFLLLGRICFLCCMAGCSPSNMQEIRCEGEEAVRKLVAELKNIESREDLEKSMNNLKKHFNRIADLLICARSFCEEEDSPPELASGEALFIELARIYEIAGGRALVEEAQGEAMRRLIPRHKK